MVQVIAHDRCRLVEQLRDLVVALVLQQLVEEVCVVSAAGLDEDLLDRGTFVLLSLARHGLWTVGYARIVRVSKGPVKTAAERNAEVFACTAPSR